MNQIKFANVSGKIQNALLCKRCLFILFLSQNISSYMCDARFILLYIPTDGLSCHLIDFAWTDCSNCFSYFVNCAAQSHHGRKQKKWSFEFLFSILVFLKLNFFSVLTPQKAGAASASKNQLQKFGSPARCVMCEVLQQTKRDPVADAMAYQTWLRGRKMKKKLREELWKMQLGHTENEMSRLKEIFKSVKWLRKDNCRILTGFSDAHELHSIKL